MISDRSVDQAFSDLKGTHGGLREGVGSLSTSRQDTTFNVPLKDLVVVEGPAGQKMHICFIRIADLHQMHSALRSRFFDRNIRYWLDEDQAVNRAITRALRDIIIDHKDDPSVFAFNHSGITLFAERLEQADGKCRLTAPRLLNGAQTVATVASFRDKNKDNPKLVDGQNAYEAIRVLCKVITDADEQFVTNVTINNNRQNAVEPWNLHANDRIQLELADKFIDDVGIYYERQENAFSQLSTADLEDYGIKEDSKAIQMLKLTQTFLLTDGQISRLSEMKRVFEDDRIYDQVFRQTRLRADTRHIVLCYKAERHLRKLADEILQRGANRYWFISRARNLHWALLCQGLLNHRDLQDIAEEYGTSMVIPAGYKELLVQIATARVRPMLSLLIQDRENKDKVDEENFSFLRTNDAFEKCMKAAYEKWDWVHKKLA